MALIPFAQMKDTIKKAFINVGLSEDDAELCATVHTQSSADGVYSHGLNRVERFCNYVKEGYVDVKACVDVVKKNGCICILDGNRGIGIKNAITAVNKAMELASAHGVGIVALRNTTHWMRGGSYGLMAAQKGYMAICFTNTESCMPAWGAVNNHLGNNPFVIALPQGDDVMLLDMAMSQYSYGKLTTTRLAGEKLPYPGGFDENGVLTDDPGAIEKSMRILPTGMWKGAAMTIMLDALAAALSAGSCTKEIDEINRGSCTGCSQIFMVFDPKSFAGAEMTQHITKTVCDYVNASEPDEHTSLVCYPGQRSLMRRKKNMAEGIPADDGVFAAVSKIAGV